MRIAEGIHWKSFLFWIYSADVVLAIVLTPRRGSEACLFISSSGAFRCEFRLEARCDSYLARKVEDFSVPPKFALLSFFDKGASFKRSIYNG